MNVSALIAALEAEGLSPEGIVRALKAADKRRDNTGAERQARFRETKRNAVTVTATPSPNERDILTPTRKENSEPKGSSQKMVETREAIGSCLKVAFALPDDIPAEPWAGWVEMRRRIRKNPTDKAKALAITELRRLRDEEGWPPGDVLNHCTMNSYQGIFPPRRDQRNERDPTTVALERLIGPHAGAG